MNTFLQGTFSVKPRTLLVALVLLAAVLGLLWASGALQSELGGNPDEAAHFVTSLMVRDWVASGLPGPPMEFAMDYYAHYPKLGIGHWPPVFYMVQAACMLVFPVSRVTALLLMALLAVALAMLIYLNLREEAGELIAAGMALVFISLPIVQTYGHLVMTEVWVMLLCFGAALLYGRYLEREGWRKAVGFSVLAVLAIMSNGKALALGLLPGFAILLGRRLDLLRRPSFWFPVLPVLVFCGPWYYFINRKMSGMGPSSGSFARRALAAHTMMLLDVLGWGLCVLAVVGLAVKVVQPLRRGRPGGKWAALTALLLSVLAFHCIIRVGVEDRYLMNALPGVVLLAGAGLRRLVDALQGAGARPAWAAPAVLLVTAGVYGVEKLTLVRKPSDGYPALVRELLAQSQFRDSLIMISANSAREGAFIAEVAIQERRPGHFVMRSSKVLASSTWSGYRYRLRFSTPADVADYLESVPVGLVAVDTDRSAPPWRAHRSQLQEALRLRPDRWQLLPLEAHRSSRLRVYRLVGHESLPVPQIGRQLRPKPGPGLGL